MLKASRIACSLAEAMLHGIVAVVCNPLKNAPAVCPVAMGASNRPTARRRNEAAVPAEQFEQQIENQTPPRVTQLAWHGDALSRLGVAPSRSAAGLADSIASRCRVWYQQEHLHVWGDPELLSGRDGGRFLVVNTDDSGRHDWSFVSRRGMETAGATQDRLLVDCFKLAERVFPEPIARLAGRRSGADLAVAANGGPRHVRALTRFAGRTVRSGRMVPE